MVPIILTSILATPIICIVSNSWLVIWIALEINTLSFCSLIHEQNSNQINEESEAAIKYFIIQSVASAILLIFISFQNDFFLIKTLFMIGTAAILINLAASPFHGWFVEIVNSMNWNNSALLITWQNLAPIYLLIFILKPWISIVVLLTAIVGSITQINAKTINEIIALSSVFNLSWIILAVIASTKLIIIFVTIYWVSVISVIAVADTTNINDINNNLPTNANQWIIVLTIAILGGIPPTLGFISNWIVLTQSLNTNLSMLCTTLLVISAVNFYVYLRAATSTSMNSNSENQNYPSNKEINLTYAIITINVPTLAMLYW